MKIFFVSTLCVLGASVVNSFVVPAAKVYRGTSVNAFAMDNQRMRNSDNFRSEEFYGDGEYRNRRDNRFDNNRREGGFSLSSNHHGAGSQYERYDPRRHAKDGTKNFNEQRFEFEQMDPRMMGGGGDWQNDMRREQPMFERGREQPMFDRGQERGRGGPPIVESAGGQGNLERYNPNHHRNNGESRFEPTRMPRNNEELLREGTNGRMRMGSESWDQPPMDRRRENMMMERGGGGGMMGREASLMERRRDMMGREGGMMERRGGMMGDRNGSFNSGNSGRLITNDDDMRRERFGDNRQMGNDDRDWLNGNPNVQRRDRQEMRSTAERLKSGGSDMFAGERPSERRVHNRNNDGRFGPVPGFQEDRRRGGRSDLVLPPGNRGRDFGNPRYERADRNFDRESRTGRRWEDPYRVGDRTMLGGETALSGPQRLDGGTRRQWTFEADVRSVQLEMWTEGLPLMATVEVFEKGGQRKNSFDVYVEDGYSRPYSTVLDLPNQSGGTILIRNDGPIEYPLVANVHPAGGDMRDDFQGMQQGFEQGMQQGMQQDMQQGGMQQGRQDGW